MIQLLHDHNQRPFQDQLWDLAAEPGWTRSLGSMYGIRF